MMPAAAGRHKPTKKDARGCRFRRRPFVAWWEAGLLPVRTTEIAMKVMVLVKATVDSEAGVMPSTELFEAMGKFNEALVDAGVMLAGEGLKPSAQGVRVAFDGPARTVVDGPFAETRELVAGFWLWQVRSMDEAIEWAKRCPNPMPGPSELEIRPLYEAEDFGAEFTDAQRAREEALRQRLGD